MKSIIKNKVLLAFLSVLVVGAVAYGAYSLAQSEDDSSSVSNSAKVEKSQSESSQSQSATGPETVTGALVSGFPGDKVPLYLGDVVESKRSETSDGRPEYNVTIKTDDSFDKVDNWTRISYVNEGWDIKNESKTLLGGVMITAHSDEYINTITYDAQDGAVVINYGITKK